MPVVPQYVFPTMVGTGKLNAPKKYRTAFDKAFKQDLESGDVVVNTRSDQLKHTWCDNDRSESHLNASPGIKDNLLEFIDELTKEVNQYAYYHFGINKERCEWVCNVAWLNELQPGGFQTRHSHCNSFLSVIYYIDMPKGAPVTAFHRPLVEMKPYFSFGTDRYHDANFEFIKPEMKEDTFIIFPSYLQHEVEMMPQCEEGKVRRTFACNFIPNRIDCSSYLLELR